MAFKRDWSFLDKITMGAVGTERVIQYLNASGHNIIELERCCTSNKIWSTKIKRLRIPDLLCLHCGKRIESRAKSKLGIIMSDADKNVERRWYSGLRETDLVAFVWCGRNAAGMWQASNTVNLFTIGDMQLTEAETKLSTRKSFYEGAEQDRTWQSYVPSTSCTVTAIEPEINGTRIVFKKTDGRNQSYHACKNYYIYVNVGDSFSKNEKIVAGIVPHTHDCGCSGEQYDFYKDLSSIQKETRYTAVKALGYLPISDKALRELELIAKSNDEDIRIKLEAYASLLRLGINVWDSMYEFVFSLNSEEMKLEYVLILGELGFDQATSKLMQIIYNSENSSELRAAAIWSLPPKLDALATIVTHCFSNEEIIANHAIAMIERHFSYKLTNTILSAFCDDENKNKICAHILATSDFVDQEAVVKKYIVEKNQNVYNWILFSIGLAGMDRYKQIIEQFDPCADETKKRLFLLWQCLPRYVTQEQNDGIAFLKKQK